MSDQKKDAFKRLLVLVVFVWLSVNGEPENVLNAVFVGELFDHGELMFSGNVSPGLVLWLKVIISHFGDYRLELILVDHLAVNGVKYAHFCCSIVLNIQLFGLWVNGFYMLCSAALPSISSLLDLRFLAR